MKSLYALGLTTTLFASPLTSTYAKPPSNQPSNQQVSRAIDNLFHNVLPNTYQVCLSAPTQKWRTPTSPVYLDGACYGECAPESGTLDQFIITCNPQKTQTISIGKPGMQYNPTNPNAVHVTVWDKCFPNTDILYDVKKGLVMMRDDFDRLINVDSLVEIRKQVADDTLPSHLQPKLDQPSMIIESSGHLVYAVADMGKYGLDNEPVITDRGTKESMTPKTQRDYLTVIQTATRALEQETRRCAAIAPKTAHNQETRVYTVHGDNPYMSLYRINDHGKINPDGTWRVDLNGSHGYEICIDGRRGIGLVGRSEAFFANENEHLCLSPEQLTTLISERTKMTDVKFDITPAGLRFDNSATFNLGPGDKLLLRR